MKTDLKILALTRYSRLGASSRLRTYQYLPHLEKQGFSMDVSPLFEDEYVLDLQNQSKNAKSALKSYAKRLWTLVSSYNQYDMFWIEKELFSYMPSVFEWFLSKTEIPYVVDYDDAIFHRYDLHELKPVRWFLSHKIDKVMRYSSLAICGNSYLQARAKIAGAKKTSVLPTVIDVERYHTQYKKNVSGNDRVVIGWIGSPTTAKYLEGIESVFKEVSDKISCKFKFIGAKPEFRDFENWTYVPWSEDTEIEEIHSFDMGIMPLTDSPWARGKCGYKLLQYMGCSKPVIASPVGVNPEIVNHRENGFLASDTKDWVEYLTELAKNENLRKKLGRTGFATVNRDYNLEHAANRLCNLFREILN